MSALQPPGPYLEKPQKWLTDRIDLLQNLGPTCGTQLLGRKPNSTTEDQPYLGESVKAHRCSMKRPKHETCQVRLQAYEVYSGNAVDGVVADPGAGRLDWIGPAFQAGLRWEWGLH